MVCKKDIVFVALALLAALVFMLIVSLPLMKPSSVPVGTPQCNSRLVSFYERNSELGGIANDLDAISTPSR